MPAAAVMGQGLNWSGGEDERRLPGALKAAAPRGGSSRDEVQGQRGDGAVRRNARKEEMELEEGALVVLCKD